MSEPIELGPRTLRALMAASIKAGDFDTDDVAIERADSLLAELAKSGPNPEADKIDPWKYIDPLGTISCIPKPGGQTRVSLPGESPFECVIRWKDRVESAERHSQDGVDIIRRLEGMLADAKASVDDARVQGYRFALNDKTNGKLDEMLTKAREEGATAERERIITLFDQDGRSNAAVCPNWVNESGIGNRNKVRAVWGDKLRQFLTPKEPS